MDEFDVTTKLWPAGTLLDLGTDSNNVTVPSTFNRHASNFESSMDGKTQYQFLFWDTGRHVTNKRHVRWNFSVGGWGVWTATRWYGIPPKGPNGPADIRVDPFSIGGDALMTGTAIDTAASTIPATAYPFNGSDRDINPAIGPVDVVAKHSLGGLEFANWLQIFWGGDDSTEFVETDTGASPGSPGFFPSGSGPFHVNKGAGAMLLAAYGNSASIVITPVLKDFLKEMFKDFGLPVSPVDPAPEDIRRLRDTIVQRLINQTRPGATTATDFQRFIDSAKTMNKEELTRARQSVQTSLDLGKTTMGVLDVQIKARG
jgi:hypothetical protein